MEVGSLFQNLATRIEKEDFLRGCRLGPCRTLKGSPLVALTEQKRDWVQIHLSREHAVCGNEVSMEPSPV